MSKSNENKPVGMPFRYYLRQSRQRVIPIAVWTVAVIVLFGMAAQRGTYVSGTGLAETRLVAVSPLIDGTLRSVSVDLFEQIEAGQIVAVLDDAVIGAELMVAEAEMGRLRSTVAAERRRLEAEFSERQADVLDDLRRFQMNEEEARVQYLEMVVQQESDTVKLERLKIQMGRYEDLVGQQIGSQELYDETRLRHETLKKELDENVAAIAAAKNQLDMATQRRAEREGQTVDTPSEDFLEPIRLALDVQEARIHEIRERRAQTALRSPIAGRITQILHRTGETVLAGNPVLMIAQEDTRRVLAYVDARASQRIQPGDEVHLQSESRPEASATARVARKGAALEELPLALRATPILTEWGYPVLIEDVPPGAFIPGERLRVRIATPSGD